MVNEVNTWCAQTLESRPKFIEPPNYPHLCPEPATCSSRRRHFDVCHHSLVEMFERTMKTYTRDEQVTKLKEYEQLWHLDRWISAGADELAIKKTCAIMAIINGVAKKLEQRHVV